MGWRSQSLTAHRHLTGPSSKARAQGLMPGYAHQAARIAIAAGRLAGMAKKRWRDADDRRMMLREVKTLRSTIDAAFEEIERALRAGTPGHTGVRDQAAAERAYAERGLQGFLALALMEEASELAEPLHAVATGRSTFEAEEASIGEEQADLRIYLHVACETAGIDHVAATEAKSIAFAERLPDLFGPDAPKGERIPMRSMEETMAAYAASQTRKDPE
jgi:NTP pyrophosphatase (non-canonical NTP hydrolase)